MSEVIQSSPTIHLTPSQSKILEMLGKGYARGIVADTVGVTEGFISQLMAEDWFSEEVQKRRFAHMQKHTALDEKYDTLEEKLLGRLEKASALLIKPLDIAKVLQVVNGAKRKGVQVTDPATIAQTIVQLSIPITLSQKFIKNANNQVVEIQNGEESTRPLVTIANGSLEKLSREVSLLPDSRGRDPSEAERTEGGFEEVIGAQKLEQLADIQAAQARLKKGLPSSQAITSDDL